MTEAQWLASDDVDRMLRFATGHAGVHDAPTGMQMPSPRKLRLIACACCRLILPKVNTHAAKIQVTREIMDRATNALDVSEALPMGRLRSRGLLPSGSTQRGLPQSRGWWQSTVPAG